MLSKNHFYYSKERNVWLPGATKILSVIAKGEGFYEWLRKNGQDSKKLLSEAGDFGSTVHNLVEAVGKGVEVNLETLKPKERRCLTAFISWKNDCVERFIATEQPIVNAKDGYGGTLDAIVEMKDGEIALLDYKTSAAIYPEAELQVVAYIKAYESTHDTKINTAYILRFEKNEDKKNDMQIVRVKDIDQLYEVFLAVTKLWYWKFGSQVKEMVADKTDEKVNEEAVNGS
jgi:hypothetical protein